MRVPRKCQRLEGCGAPTARHDVRRENQTNSDIGAGSGGLVGPGGGGRAAAGCCNAAGGNAQIWPVCVLEVWWTRNFGKKPCVMAWLTTEKVALMSAWLATIDASVTRTNIGQNSGLPARARAKPQEQPPCRG